MKWTEMTSTQRDALVAEKVMGWHWVEANHQDVSRVKHQVWLLPPDVHDDILIAPGEWGYYVDIPDDPLYVDTAKLIPLNLLPSYTTDMNAALQIIELDRFSNVSIERQWRSEYIPPEQYYLCRIVTHGDLYYCNAATAQEAVCLAALSACGIEVAL